MLVYGQTPAGAFPLMSWPLGSFVGGVAVPVEPPEEITPEPGRGGGGYYSSPRVYMWDSEKPVAPAPKSELELLTLSAFFLEELL